jgi:hypothetical protein
MIIITQKPLANNLVLAIRVISGKRGFRKFGDFKHIKLISGPSASSGQYLCTVHSDIEVDARKKGAVDTAIATTEALFNAMGVENGN